MDQILKDLADLNDDHVKAKADLKKASEALKEISEIVPSGSYAGDIAAIKAIALKALTEQGNG